MARYMISVFGPAERTHFGNYPSKERDAGRVRRTRAFNEMERAGHFVLPTAWNRPPQPPPLICRGEKPILTDGPYLESKEYLGGFRIIEAADLNEALDLAAQGFRACRGRVEVRSFQSAESLPGAARVVIKSPVEEAVTCAIHRLASDRRSLRPPDGAQPLADRATQPGVAVAELDGPDHARTEIDQFTETHDGYHAFHAARAALLQPAGRGDEALTAYAKAIRLTGNPAERAYPPGGAINSSVHLTVRHAALATRQPTWPT